jgi:dTDP-4-dehydrorhamnose reductase
MHEQHCQDHASHGIELWGGHECTVNRLRDSWHDQSEFSGHHQRPQDLDLFASLGITSLRYPALWEKISPHDPQQRDFSWTDERYARLRRLGLNPIVTLCHHGSGPHYTSLSTTASPWAWPVTPRRLPSATSGSATGHRSTSR